MFSVQGPEAACDLQERLSFHIHSRIDQNLHRKGHFTALMRAAGQKPPHGSPVMALAKANESTLAKANVADESVVVFIGCARQDSLRTLETNLFPESSLPSHPGVVCPPPRLRSWVKSHFLSRIISRRSAATSSREFLGAEPFSETPPPDLRFITILL